MSAAEFNLEHFIELFDQALTSDDPRVVNALRQLMMMVALTATDKDKEIGPIQRKLDEIDQMYSRLSRIEAEIMSDRRAAEDRKYRGTPQWDPRDVWSTGRPWDINSPTLSGTLTATSIDADFLKRFNKNNI